MVGPLQARRPLPPVPLRILVADGERAVRESCATVLRAEGYAVVVAASGQEALEIVRRQAFDVVLLDWHMNGAPSADVLRATRERHAASLVIVMSGKPSVEASLEALQAGAWDYLPKPFSGTQLQILVGRAALTTRPLPRPHAAPSATDRLIDQPLVPLGESPAFLRVIDLARRVAQTDASVFITGESGSGKELIAQFIHRHSRRSDRPFVPLNCAALPEALLESEMFGHCRGAFTGAVRDKPGLLETADGGTLFLDETTEMSRAIQAKLLRVIQDGVVRRVGSERPNTVVNVRFIAATNRDPEATVAAGTLREDLFYRLRVVPIHVPALRERPEDIPLLANRFLERYWVRHRDPSLPIPEFSREALWALGAQPWAGNVRELQNVIEHAVVLLEPGAEIQAHQLPFLTPAQTPEAALAEADRNGGGPGKDDEGGYYVARDKLMAQFDKRFLSRVITRAGGNLSKAARLAGIDRTTFYRLMERHGLKRGPFVSDD